MWWISKWESRPGCEWDPEKSPMTFCDLKYTSSWKIVATDLQYFQTTGKLHRQISIHTKLFRLPSIMHSMYLADLSFDVFFQFLPSASVRTQVDGLIRSNQIQNGLRYQRMIYNTSSRDLHSLTWTQFIWFSYSFILMCICFQKMRNLISFPVASFDNLIQ